MRLRFGTTARGRVDTAAAGTAMGVSRRTVQRWLHSSHGRSLAHIPPARLQQLIVLLLPSEETRTRETQAARYARQAIDRLALPGKAGVLPAWERQHWTEPHLVAVLELRDAGIRQVAVCRDVEARRKELTRRGRVVEQVVVPTRFHATVLAHQVLEEVTPWRFQAGAAQATQGYTQAWTRDAPRVSLTPLPQMAVTDQDHRAPSLGEQDKPA